MNDGVVCSLATFTESSAVQLAATWPAPNGDTETEVTANCWRRVTNASVIGTPCHQTVANSSITSAIVLMCIKDVQVMHTSVVIYRQYR